jgi:putative ABC transport system permease protein
MRSPTLLPHEPMNNASRPLTTQLYGVETHDPWTLASVALVLTVVALLATFRPAQKASRIDPIALLRTE